MKILFVGCGNMGAAIAAGALRKIPGLALSVVDPDVARAQALLPDDRVTFHADITAVRDETFDATVLAIKPQMFHALPEDALPAQGFGLVVSIMAGVTLAGLQHKLGHSRIVRTMPNLPALVGAGMTVGYAAPDLAAGDRPVVETLFAGSGQFAWLPEETLVDSATAVAGSGPGYVFAFAEHMIAAAQAVGLEAELADRLVRQTLLGAASLLHSDPRTAAELKQAVTSKKGTTEAGLGVFEGPGGLPDLCRSGVAAARDRAQELSKAG